MELFVDQNYYVLLQKNGRSLWCSRTNGTLVPQNEILNANLRCLGIVQGLVGKFRLFPEREWNLLLIQSSDSIGSLPDGRNINKITKVCLLPLAQHNHKDLDLQPCPRHHNNRVSFVSKAADAQKLQVTWNRIKSVADNIKPQKKKLKDKEKVEKKILDEVVKMFNNTESFYYCVNGDITSNNQRLRTMPATSCVLDTMDDRFFWNKSMLHDLLSLEWAESSPWLLPVIQGYVHIEDCPLDMKDDYSDPSTNMTFKFCLLSRRSRHRAGTRYMRRGVDKAGHAANYVETEQMLSFANHTVSFVIVRGSVPLYWSQSGLKYKPTPRIERDEAQNTSAFQQHFTDELDRYRQVVCVSLVDQTGKEKVIADTYLKHVVTLNCPEVTFVAFDFHSYCRGMNLENVSILTENISDIIQSMQYCWVHELDVINRQSAVFRVNCIDCLDRTNIVQSAICRLVLENQCYKLGLLSPEQHLATRMKSLYQHIWARNGDVISQQYAGTAALKGDYTRTGERKLAGMMKDGVNSANRYYINQVKDGYRQAAISFVLGHMSAGESIIRQKYDAPDATELVVEKEMNLDGMAKRCRKELLGTEDCLGSWTLVDRSQQHEVVDEEKEISVVLLLTSTALFVVYCDDELDQISRCHIIPLNEVLQIDVGVERVRERKQQVVYLRVRYQQSTESSGIHQFMTTGYRLFNNMVVPMESEEDIKDYLGSIRDTVTLAKRDCVTLNPTIRPAPSEPNSADLTKNDEILNSVVTECVPKTDPTSKDFPDNDLYPDSDHSPDNNPLPVKDTSRKYLSLKTRQRSYYVEDLRDIYDCVFLNSCGVIFVCQCTALSLDDHVKRSSTLYNPKWESLDHPIKQESQPADVRHVVDDIQVRDGLSVDVIPPVVSLPAVDADIPTVILDEPVRRSGLLTTSSSVKPSHSESKLTARYLRDSIEVTINFDEMDFPTKYFGALQKLKQLATSPGALNANRTEELRKVARQRKQHSLMRFKELKTKIILL